MARIRTIKPEFWKDGRIKRLTPACALFFIGLWNFCDDEGKIRADALELSLSLPLFRSQDIVKYLRTLAEVGLTQVSVDREWIVVTNWEHQKIDKPRVPKTLKSEIKWLEVFRENHSPNTLRTFGDESSNIRRKDSIGKERKGKDRIPVGDKSAKKPKSDTQPTLVESPPAGAPLSAAALKGDAIGRYYELWQDRYHDRAPLMPADHKKLKDLAGSLGAENAISLIEGYFSMPDSWFVSKRHDVQSLMSNLAKVQHFIATGNVVTRRDADSVESSVSLANQLQRLGGAV